MADLVECRSDHAYLGYPVAFHWQGIRLEVDEILFEHRNPEGYLFQVRNNAHGIFALTYNSMTDQWSVEQH